MVEEGQVTDKGDQGADKGKTGDQASLGWRAALPDEYKEHEFVKGHAKPGDFVKVAIDTKTERDALKTERDTLKTRMDGAIFKPGKDAKPEEQAAYRKALGVPETPEGYAFKDIEGQENSPEMLKWFGGVSHKYNVPKDAADGIRQEFNEFVKGMVQAEEKVAEDERVMNEKKFHDQFKSEDEYKAGYELSKRFWNKVTGTNFDEVYKEAEAWQVPQFMNFIFNVAKMTGEDNSPLSRGAGGERKEGMVYDKSPAPPNRQ